jgi:hypothetical protein
MINHIVHVFSKTCNEVEINRSFVLLLRTIFINIVPNFKNDSCIITRHYVANS